MRKQFSIFEKWLLAASLLLFSGVCVGQQPAAEPPQSPPPAQTETPAANEAPAPLRVMVGKSLLINTTDRLKRVSVTDPDVADALVVTPTKGLGHGASPGEGPLRTWGRLDRSRG